MKLLLASKSETRRQMLDAAGVGFEPVETKLEEEEAKSGLIAAGFVPRDLAEMLAEMKAGSACPDGEALVLGADQVLERDDGSMLSKPRSRAELFDQLGSLSGRTHLLHSAAVVIDASGRRWGHTESVSLKMRPLTADFLETYLDREYEAVRWNVGGYRIEGLGAQLFEEIRGSHFAILGLPLLPLLGFLREIDLLPS